MGYYIVLLGGIVRLAESVEEWSAWYEADIPMKPFEEGGRRVTYTEFGSPDKRVSTVFLPIDHSFGGPTPLLFETMAFGFGSEIQERYETVEEARQGHQQIVAELTHEKIP